MDTNKTDMKHNRHKTIPAAIVTSATIVGVFVAVYQFVVNYSMYDLTGEWMITDTIEKTSYHPHRGLRLAFRVHLIQKGRDITATGEKWSENDVPLPSRLHTPIKITGSINGKRITATFEEEGAERRSGGIFYWTIQEETNSLRGTFTSTSADTSGSSDGKRVVH